MGVETKVDSNATFEQLTATAQPPEQVGILLALGVTAFAITARDLQRYEMEDWQALNPAGWAEALREAGVGDDERLAPYLAEVERERDAHRRALERAQAGGIPEVDGESRCGDHRLDHGAWMCALRTGLGDALGGRLDDWWVETTQGGPVMVLWSTQLSERVPGRDVYLQVSCTSRRRTLGLRVGGGNGDAQEVRDLLAPIAASAGLPAPGRGRGATFNVASVDLTAHGAADAADQVLAVLDALLTALS